MIGVGQKPSCWHSAVHRIKQRLLLLFDQIYWWRLGGTASRCSMNSRWTAGISTVRVDINLIHKTPLWLCFGRTNSRSQCTFSASKSFSHFPFWSLGHLHKNCRLLRALAKGKGFSKGTSFPPGPQGAADFFWSFSCQSWIFLLWESGAQGAQAQVHATTPSTVPGEGDENVSDWRPRFQSTEGKFDKVNIFCLGCYPSNHR